MTKQEAIEYIKAHCNPDYPKGRTEWETAMNMAIEALSAQPEQDGFTMWAKSVADSYRQPELIRCKDCKWWDKTEDSPFGYCMAMKHGYMSSNWEIGIYRKYKGDFYCADGERGDSDDSTGSD